ncbi:hypothetical protein M2275_006628 [Rhodococcus opacus]|nr:hypothetical protein [Rhodococcus opacus]
MRRHRRRSLKVASCQLDVDQLTIALGGELEW